MLLKLDTGVSQTPLAHRMTKRKIDPLLLQICSLILMKKMTSLLFSLIDSEWLQLAMMYSLKDLVPTPMNYDLIRPQTLIHPK